MTTHRHCAMSNISRRGTEKMAHEAEPSSVRVAGNDQSAAQLVGERARRSVLKHLIA